MPEAHPPVEGPDEQVIVTFASVEAVLGRQEAVESIQEAANQDLAASPAERAAAMAAIGHILNQLRSSEQEAGATVLTTAQHGPASRLQSLIASGELGTLTTAPLETGGLEAKFDTHDWGGWAQVAWVKLKSMAQGKHPQLVPATATPEALPETARIAVLGDWGTGLYGAPRIAQTIANDPDPYAMLLHLGDVYYSGTDKEVRGRFLKLWPDRPEAVHRALNSNHEMYSGGKPYFTRTLPRFGQTGSYFAAQNSSFTLVGLDVAYEDHDIDDRQVQWLESVLAQAGDRKVILFSHHQLFSHWESQGTKLRAHPGFSAILASGRIFVWYWAHEHRCTLFEEREPSSGIWARCLGNSGMPQSRHKTKGLPRATEAKYSLGEWRRSGPKSVAGKPLPRCVVLEGENPYIPGEEAKFSPHSFAVLTLDGPNLREQVLDPDGTVLYDELLAT